MVNKNGVLPFKCKNETFFLYTPWGEQANGIAATLNKFGFPNTACAKQGTLSDAQVKANIEQCDVFIVGTLATKFSPVETDGISGQADTGARTDDPNKLYMRYAKQKGKTVVHVSMRAPYDIVDYESEADCALATYSYYGYDNGKWRSMSMQSLGEVLVGHCKPQGKLPVDTWYKYDEASHSGKVAYPRGFGLTF